MKANNDISSILDIKIGVPQGSILAPILFQIYINDLLQIKLFSKPYAYADDTVFTTSHPDPCDLTEICNKDLISINNWCISNHMTININKSHFLFAGDKNYSIKLKVGNKNLTQKQDTKLLGFNFTDNFSWNIHCDSVFEKVSKNTNLLQLCRPYLTTYSAKQFYYQFIHSYLIYGIHIYYNLSPSTYTNRIFLQQKRALRIIANVHHIPYHLISTNEMCTHLKILPLPLLNNYFTYLYGFKVMYNLSPQYISDFFVNVENRFPKRVDKLIKVPLDNLNHVVACKFNGLPYQIRSIDKFKHFKTMLIKHIYQSI